MTATTTRVRPEPEPGTPEERRRFPGLPVDPIGPLLALLAGAIYWLHGVDGYLSRDLGLYSYAGQQVADGVAPYDGVVNRSGPLSHLLPGVGATLGRLVGADDVHAMRVFFLFLAAACIWVSYLVGRDLFRSRLAGTASALALLTITGFIEYASNGPREKTPMVLFLLLVVLALAHRRYGWAGVFVALATLTWQPAFFVGLPTAAVGVWALPRTRRLRGLGAIALGGGLTLGAFLAFYAAIGSLHTFLECFVLIHVQYTRQPGLGTEWAAVRDLMVAEYGTSLWVMVAGIVGSVVGALLVLAVRSRRQDPDHRLLVAVGAGTIAGLLWCLKAFNGFPDIFFLLPSMVVGIGWIAQEVRSWTPRPAAVAVTLVWALVATPMALDYSIHHRDHTLTTQRAEVDAVFDLLPQDATVVAVEAPQPLVLTGRTNPYPHQMFSLGLEDYVNDSWPGGLKGLSSDIERRRPTVIALGTIRPDWLEPILAKSYVDVGTTPGWTWYVTDTISQDKVAELRRATSGE